jgi:hypothetical protein
MMYKTQGMSPAFMEEVQDIEEFLRYRELVAKGMGFVTEIVNNKLFLYDKGKEFGIYYAEKGE